MEVSANGTAPMSCSQSVIIMHVPTQTHIYPLTAQYIYDEYVYIYIYKHVLNPCTGNQNVMFP